MKKSVGIIGCGAIGSTLAEYAAKRLREKVGKILLFDIDLEKAENLAKKIPKVKIYKSLEKIYAASDLIIEAANSAIMPKLVRMAISKRKDILVMSIGGFSGRENLIELARRKNIMMILPSGAIGGIDIIKSLNIGGIRKVMLTTRKGPESLKGAPYLLAKGIDVSAIKKETCIFEGTARQAIKGFPKNVNIAELLSIAGIGASKTKVRIIVSPECTKNIHEISVEARAGATSIRVENVPFPSNPKTSYLAALSAIAALRGYFDNVRIGT